VNYRSIDPCSFFAMDTFDALDKKVSGQVSYADLAGCHLIFVGSNGEKEYHNWTVGITMDYRFSTPAELATGTPGSYTATTSGGIPVIAGKSRKGTCLRVFQLPGDFASAVIEVKSDADPCQAADLALTSALAAVRSGDLAPASWPKNSLIPQDLCVAFKSAAGAAIGRAVAGVPKGLHTCSWRSPGSYAVSMNLEATTWPPLGLDSRATTRTMAGHPAKFVKNAGDGQFLYLGAVNLGSIKVGVPKSSQVVSVILGGKGDGTAQRDGFIALLTAIATGR
jgi:hypothetical protein